MNVSHMWMLKPGRFNGIEVHRPISYENIMCIWKQTEKPTQNKGVFLSFPPKSIFSV